jgi:hypothetical protein
LRLSKKISDTKEARAMDAKQMREAIGEYKDQYFEMYGHKPPEVCIVSFCKINGIPWPLPPDGEEPEGVPEEFWRDGPYDG